MIPAIADTKEALALSVYYEVTKRLLSEAIEGRDRTLLSRGNLKMLDDRFEKLPRETQRELMGLYSRAITVTTGWGAP